MHPGSGSAAKSWPADRFAALVQRHARDTRWLLVTGPADEGAADHRADRGEAIRLAQGQVPDEMPAAADARGMDAALVDVRTETERNASARTTEFVMTAKWGVGEICDLSGCKIVTDA